MGAVDGRRHVGDPVPAVLGGMWHGHNTHTRPNEVLENVMAILSNSRHEKFSQLVASGIQPAAAYRSLGCSSKGAPQSANKLRKRSDVRGRVDEIRQAAAISTAAETAFDQQQVLNRLDVLSHKAEDLGQISVAVRCEELIGKHRGMFIDRQVAEVAISSEPSIAEVLRMR